MSRRPIVSVLVACHNRRSKTLACLAALQAQRVDAHLRPLVYDDGSSDGTAAAIGLHFPHAEVVAGSGHAFWAGGMRALHDRALGGEADFILWLNDDVVLHPDALDRLLATHAKLEAQGWGRILVGGAVADPRTGCTAYGGIDRPWRLDPLRFRRIVADPMQPTPCATLNGNVVLMSRATGCATGPIAAAFVHTLADLDYGLRVGRAGGWVGLAAGHVGTCEANIVGARWLNPALPLAARWRILGTPLGLPVAPWLSFARAHGGPLWFVLAAKPYWRLFIPLALVAAARWTVGLVRFARAKEGAHARNS